MEFFPLVRLFLVGSRLTHARQKSSSHRLRRNCRNAIAVVTRSTTSEQSARIGPRVCVYIPVPHPGDVAHLAFVECQWQLRQPAATVEWVTDDASLHQQADGRCDSRRR